MPRAAIRFALHATVSVGRRAFTRRAVARPRRERFPTVGCSRFGERVCVRACARATTTTRRAARVNRARARHERQHITQTARKRAALARTLRTANNVSPSAITGADLSTVSAFFKLFPEPARSFNNSDDIYRACKHKTNKKILPKTKHTLSKFLRCPHRRRLRRRRRRRWCRQRRRRRK